MSANIESLSYSARNTQALDNESLWNSQYWLKNPSFDLLFITGGAFFTLFIAAMVFQWPLLLPVFFWIWIIGFEGSHFWATFSRTYIDKKFRSEQKTVLSTSLVFFLFPALALALDQAQQHISFTVIYGYFIFVWSLYHNARQHYGFLSIYSQKAQIPSDLKAKMVRTMYWTIGIAQIYFLLNFKTVLVFKINPIASYSPELSFVLLQLPIIISLALFSYLLILTKEALNTVGPKALISLFYIAVCCVFYSTMFYFIAPNDHFVQNMSGGETLMLIAIMNSLFHNIQYHAIVWYYGNRRYNEKNADHKEFGLARIVNYKTLNYLSIAILLGLVFAFITWNVGDWPGPSGSWTHVSTHHWAYILFFGIIGHHFYLDQKIWRPSQSQELRSYLKLSAKT